MRKRVRASAPLDGLLESWLLALRSENKALKTQATYSEGVNLFIAFQRAARRPLAVGDVTPEDIRAFIADQLARWKPHTALNRYRALWAFFAWCVEDGELADHPMAHLKPPKIPDDPPSVIADADITRLLDSCAGPSFDDRRDNALIRFLLDTGCRRSEVAGLTMLRPDMEERVSGIDLQEGTALVKGKGDKMRMVAFGARTARALDRYLRLRKEHAYAKSPAFWLGRRGPVQSNGLYQIIRDRAEPLGLDLYTHLFRHTWAHLLKSADIADSDLETLAGWTSPAMSRRYGRIKATERAIKAHKSRSPGDRF